MNVSNFASSPAQASLQAARCVMLQGPDAAYAAIIEAKPHAIVLESTEGRCVRTRPVRGELVSQPFENSLESLFRRGYEVMAQATSSLPADFLSPYSAEAGFTGEQVQQSLRMCA